MNKLFSVAILLLTGYGLSGQQFEIPQNVVGYWFKGNIHTHTNKADGDTSPEEVAMWYKSHGYNFLAITDHPFITMPSNYNSIIDANFILIAGEETTVYIRTD